MQELKVREKWGILPEESLGTSSDVSSDESVCELAMSTSAVVNDDGTDHERRISVE